MADVSNGSIYELVDRTRVELKGDIIRLEAKFDALEAGRLTRAEQNIGNLQVREATLNTKVYVLVFIISSAVSAIMTAVAMRIFGK
jgi:hypothetical protein